MPITGDQAHTLSLPTPPTTPDELATILSTTFLLVPEARFFGAPLGDFFKALRVQLRPRTAAAEQDLAYMFRPALALIPSFRVNANTVWRRTPPQETPAAEVSRVPNHPSPPQCTSGAPASNPPRPTLPAFVTHGPGPVALPSASPPLPPVTLPLGRRVSRPLWLLFDQQEDSLCNPPPLVARGRLELTRPGWGILTT